MDFATIINANNHEIILKKSPISWNLNKNDMPSKDLEKSKRIICSFSINIKIKNINKNGIRNFNAEYISFLISKFELISDNFGR